MHFTELTALLSNVQLYLACNESFNYTVSFSPYNNPLSMNKYYFTHEQLRPYEMKESTQGQKFIRSQS
jgi:hypothetical protein